MTPDSKIDCAGAPLVMLAGNEWFVPILAMRQARIVVPGLMRLMPTLQLMQSGEIGAMARLTREDFDILVEIVHAALTRAYPTLSREEFLDLPISTPELVGALAVIIRQTGFFKASPNSMETPGEAPGETPTSSTAPQNASIDSSLIIASVPAKPGPTISNLR